MYVDIKMRTNMFNAHIMVIQVCIYNFITCLLLGLKAFFMTTRCDSMLASAIELRIQKIKPKLLVILCNKLSYNDNKLTH